jgi:FKBP-type peptidyl-prolyl cis-trans isomerase
MGVTARIKCKKLVMAAKRLATTRNEFTVGHVFDSYSEYQFIRGQTKLIRGMELGIAAMKPGEVAVLVIRSDYAYGSEGYSKTNGDVMVPPFATLQFEVKILR